MSLLENRTAVITGGAQGIGFAIARSFVAQGAKVVIGDLDLDAATAAAEKLGSRDVARAVKANVVESADWDTLLAEASRPTQCCPELSRMPRPSSSV